MEEMAKAPLNQAHLLDRSADSFAKKQQHEKAIQCREKAIECLLDAKGSMLSADSISSLDLQIAANHHKLFILREHQRHKERRLPLTPRRSDQSSLREIPEKTSSKPDAGPSISSQDLLPHSQMIPESREVDIESAIRREILKGDKLLESLVSQQSTEMTPDGENHGGTVTRLDSLMITSAIKLPKPVEQVLEELQCHNEQLKALIGVLLGELEELKGENGRLKIRIVDLENGRDSVDATKTTAGQSSSSHDVSSDVSKQYSDMDLPPLDVVEVPKMLTSFKPKAKVPPRKSRMSE